MNPAPAVLRNFFAIMAHELINTVGTVSVHLQMCEVAETANEVHNSVRRAESGTQDLIALLQLVGEWAEGFAPDHEASREEWVELAKKLVQIHVNRYGFPKTTVEVLDTVSADQQLVFRSDEPALFDLSRSSLALQMLTLLMSKQGLTSGRGDADLYLNFG